MGVLLLLANTSAFSPLPMPSSGYHSTRLSRSGLAAGLPHTRYHAVTARSMGTQMAANAASHTVALTTGIDMEYRVAESAGAAVGGKPPLVFIHGSFHGSWCWAELWMPFFAERGFPCFAMSLRGTSATPQIAGATSVQLSEHIEDISCFIQQVLPASAPPPILIGHSFGGMYAQKICEANSLKIGALVCVAGKGIRVGVCM